MNYAAPIVREKAEAKPSEARVHRLAKAMTAGRSGYNLAKMSERLRNPAEWSSAAPIVRESLESAPAGVSPQALEALRNLLAILENERRTIETRNDIGKQISVIFNIK